MYNYMHACIHVHVSYRPYSVVRKFYTHYNFWHNSLDICFQILLDNPKMLFSLSRI